MHVIIAVIILFSSLKGVPDIVSFAVAGKTYFRFFLENILYYAIPIIMLKIH